MRTLRGTPVGLASSPTCTASLAPRAKESGAQRGWRTETPAALCHCASWKIPPAHLAPIAPRAHRWCTLRRLAKRRAPPAETPRTTRWSTRGSPLEHVEASAEVPRTPRPSTSHSSFSKYLAKIRPGVLTLYAALEKHFKGQKPSGG